LTSLRDKGLTRRLEVLTVQRQVTDMQREMRLSEVTASRAQRELNDIDKRASDLVNLRQAEVGQALIDTEAEIVALRTKLENQAKLLPAGSNLVQTGDESALEGELVVSYEVVRLNADGVAKPIQADEGFLLMPGDVLKVLPGTAGPVTTSTISN
jgi:predicted  nucleic acid-binding Zn-ribbon protein